MSIKLLWPCDRGRVVITDNFQDHRTRPGYKGSLANDLASLGGVKIPLWSVQNNGKVVVSRFDTTGYGNEIQIEYPDIGIKVQYAHLDSRSAFTDGKVQAGEMVGVMGTTGNSTGVHCHFAVWLNGKNIDPLDPANGIVMVNTVAELGEVTPPAPVEPPIVTPPAEFILPDLPELPRYKIVSDTLALRRLPYVATTTFITKLYQGEQFYVSAVYTDPKTGMVWYAVMDDDADEIKRIGWACAYEQGWVYLEAVR